MPSASNQHDDGQTAGDRPAAPEFVAKVERLLGLIRPAIQDDGGDVELVSVSEAGLVRIRLHGACVGCPSAHMTLHHGIERTLRSELGGAIRVEAIS